MAEFNTKLTRKYFAASNGYHGFKSFFKEVFSPANFERIYVVKGGPGTGKSSLMKKVLSELSKNSEAEEILCSSDPNSLDGVILERSGKKIALLDGTAPHETDASLPGAYDEIIDLGEFWDKRWLVSQKEKIYKINKEKKEAYKSAYEYLKIANECNCVIQNSLRSIYSKRDSMKKALDIAKNFSQSEEKNDLRLVSSFGKNGYLKLDTLNLLGNKRLNINISDFYYGLFMEDLKAALDMLGISYTAFPSSPDLNVFDAFYIKSEDTIVGKLTEGESIDLSFLAPENDLIQKERFRVAEELRRFALEESQRQFSIASELHFALEEIYSSAMNFDGIDVLLEKIKSDSEEIWA